MKKALIIFSLILFSIYLNSQTFIESFPEVKGRYFGQKAPKTPQKFAPGIISLDGLSNGCSAFNHNGTAFVYKRVNENDSVFIYYTVLEKGVWTKPRKTPFNSKFYVGDFTFSPDGEKIYYSSCVPINGSDEQGDSNIWAIDFIDKKWGIAKILDAPVNTDKHESYPSIAENGNLYFFYRDRGGYGKSDLCYSELRNNKYSFIINMGATFNTEEDEWDPYIAPDESYIIYCSSKDSFGEDDLFISFRRDDRSWTKPVNMGEEFNSPESENRPYVTSDGRYFFYTSRKDGNRHIYWVNAERLEDFMPEDMIEY